MSNQLIKETALGREQVFPKNYILNLKDKDSGANLEDILKSFNMLFLSYLGNKVNTRKQVPMSLRHGGLWITYIVDNTVVTEWYDSTAVDDYTWGSDAYWREGSNMLVGDISISKQGTWVINGEDTGISPKGDKGDSPIIRIYNNKIQVSYDKGVTYEDLNNTPVYTKFRFNSLTNTYLVSYDLGANWEDISDEKVYHKFKYNLATNTYLESIDFGKTWFNISAEKVYTKFRFNRNTNTYQVSTDLGLNWTDISSDKVYYQFRYNRETNTHLVSTDFGTTWTNVSEDKVFYLFRTEGNRLLVSTDLGNTWENCSEPIAAWFRWTDTSGTGNVGKVLISRDNKTWSDLSPTITNNLYIKGYVSTVGDLPTSSAAIGDIYMVGPTYDESDTTHDYPHYRMWVKLSSGWVDNGEYQSNVLISLTTGLETGITMSLKAITDTITAINETLDKKMDGVYIENPEFIHVLTDSEGRILWGLLNNGKVMYGAGIPDQIAILIEEIYDTFGRYTDNPEFIEAKCDNAGRLIYGVLTDGDFKFGKMPSQITELVNELKEEINSIGEWVDNPEFARVIKDSKDRIIDYTDKNGRRWIHDLHADNIPENFSEVEDVEGRMSIEKDSGGRIISYRDSDGVLHEEKGINTKEINADNVSCNHIDLSDSAATELTEVLKKIGFKVETPVDWSNEIFINLPSLPTCALINITGVDSMPTSKTTNAKMIVEVWDMNGNYFKKKCIGNAQGESSMAHPKKNFALDFCEDDWIGDGTTTIKIGPWVSQDSFHFKAFATSITKAECPIGYKIFEKFLETKPFHKRAPYMEYYEGDYTTSNSPSNDLAQNMQFQARCYPDGFPCVVYLNGAFYGIFSWQLKKHRDNMAMGRNKTDHIHLDGYLADSNMWDGNISWGLVEIRNPKPKTSKWTLLCQDGSKYDGDSPKEIMGEDSEFYNANDISCKNSAATKTILINATNYMSEIQVFEDAYKSDATEENLNVLKAEIEKRFSVEWMVDYVLLMNLLQDGDSISKNIQWATWGAIDGTVKWYPLPYDLDAAFGISSTTAFGFSAPYKTTIGKGTKSPVRYVWDYYYNELISRYKELREKNVISYNEIMSLFLNWGKAIGFDNYEKEYEKWPESPCNRDACISKLWERTGVSYVTYWPNLTTFRNDTTYSLGVMTSVNGRCYKSLQNNNIGHNPIESPEWWENVYIKEGTYNKGDVIYDGRSNFYQFRALDTVVVDAELNNRPFTKFYTMYPFEGGSFDSIYRISKWIEEKIKVMDLQFV